MELDGVGGWSGIKAALDTLYGAVYGAGGTYRSPFYIRGIGAIWFLWASFWASCILRLLLEIDWKKRLVITMLLFAFGYYSKRLFWFPFSIQAGCCAVLFMYLGYLVRKMRGPLLQMPLEVKAAGVMLALWMWIDFIRNFQSFNLVEADIGKGITDIVGCISACSLVVLFSWFLEKRTNLLGKALSTIGRHSLVVLCVHTVELEAIPWGMIMEKLVEYGMPPVFQSSCMRILAKACFICIVSAVVVKLKGRHHT